MKWFQYHTYVLHPVTNYIQNKNIVSYIFLYKAFPLKYPFKFPLSSKNFISINWFVCVSDYGVCQSKMRNRRNFKVGPNYQLLSPALLFMSFRLASTSPISNSWTFKFRLKEKWPTGRAFYQLYLKIIQIVSYNNIILKI